MHIILALHEKKWKSNRDLLIVNNNYGLNWCIVAQTSKCMFQAEQWILLGEGLYQLYYILYHSYTGFLPSPDEFVELYREMKGIGK